MGRHSGKEVDPCQSHPARFESIHRMGHIVCLGQVPETHQRPVDSRSRGSYRPCVSSWILFRLYIRSFLTGRRYDAFIYTKALSTRKPGTTTLHLIEKANHNFTAHKEEVVNTIVRWWDHYNKGNLEPVNISLIDMKALL